MPNPFGAWGELANICKPAKPVRSLADWTYLNDGTAYSSLMPTYSPPLLPSSAGVQSINVAVDVQTAQTDYMQIVQNNQLSYYGYPGYTPPVYTLTNEWQRTYGTGTYGTSSWFNSLPAIPETPEQKAERRHQAHLDDLAAARAKALLLEMLSEDQKAEYEEHEYFHVIGQSGKLYRIKRGSIGNVYSIGLDGNEEHKYCIHARSQVPHEDNMIAQALMLSSDEEKFLVTANRHW